ncbi:hypothetical protein [Spirosoma arcticum]
MTNPVASWAMSLSQPPSGERGGTDPGPRDPVRERQKLHLLQRAIGLLY